MQVHPDFAGTARHYVARKLDKYIGHRHLVVRKVDGLETESLAKRLETRQVLRVRVVISRGRAQRLSPSVSIVMMKGVSDMAWSARQHHFGVSGVSTQQTFIA